MKRNLISKAVLVLTGLLPLAIQADTPPPPPPPTIVITFSDGVTNKPPKVPCGRSRCQVAKFVATTCDFRQSEDCVIKSVILTKVKGSRSKRLVTRKIAASVTSIPPGEFRDLVPPKFNKRGERIAIANAGKTIRGKLVVSDLASNVSASALVRLKLRRLNP